MSLYYIFVHLLQTNNIHILILLYYFNRVIIPKTSEYIRGHGKDETIEDAARCKTVEEAGVRGR